MTVKTTNIDVLLRTLAIKKASDLHLQVGTPPVFRINGDLKFSDLEPLTREDLEHYIGSLMTEQQRRHLEEIRHLDVSYALPGVARFRVHVFRQKGEFGVALRIIPFKIPTMEDLGLAPVIKDLANRPNGLVLVTGPTGSGKSTTLASVIDYINGSRKAHIVTIEDPIEFEHSNKNCMVNQRELGQDTESFGMALRDALREDPDVILVGELRDLETISAAMTAAETGHLVFSTLHTNDVAQTMDRIIDVFPPHQQPEIRTQLANVIQGVIAQTLCKLKDGSGRIAAFETMVANTAIRNLIREGKSQQVYNVVQTSRQAGMMLMKDYLKILIDKGLITQEEAATKVGNVTASSSLK